MSISTLFRVQKEKRNQTYSVVLNHTFFLLKKSKKLMSINFYIGVFYSYIALK